MRFDLFRLVLNKKANLFAFSGTREEWLREALSSPFLFTHRKQTYHYVPATIDIPTDFLGGRIGRSINVRENEPPEAGLEEVTRETWTAARIAIDPSTHEDGQKVAVEAFGAGTSLPLLKSFAAHLGARSDAPYVVVANPIIESNSFIKFLQDHPNDVTVVQFTLNAPNMFSDRTNVDAEMRAARDKLNAKKARVTLANEQGMTLQNPVIRQLAEYAAKGGGEIKAKTITNQKFSSERVVDHVTIDEVRDTDERSIWALILDRVFGK